MSSPVIQPVSFGHSVAVAQQALTGALAAVLAANGSSAEEWFALNTIAVRGAVTPAEAIREELRRAPRATAGDVDATLAALTAAGLVTTAPHGDSEVFTLTPEGSARHGELGAAVRGLTATMLADLDPEAVAATSALLATVTERANAAATAAAA
jgi:DNA-binding MarR family transcriptional regulator